MWWHVLELGKESGLSSAELRVLGGEEAWLISSTRHRGEEGGFSPRGLGKHKNFTGKCFKKSSLRGKRLKFAS